MHASGTVSEMEHSPKQQRYELRAWQQQCDIQAVRKRAMMELTSLSQQRHHTTLIYCSSEAGHNWH